MTPVFTGILVWYISITIFFLVALLNNNFIYVKQKDAFLNTRRGSTIVYLLSSTIILLTPLFTEPNSLHFYNDVILPNVYSSLYILVLLTILKSRVDDEIACAACVGYAAEIDRAHLNDKPMERLCSDMKKTKTLVIGNRTTVITSIIIIIELGKL